MKRSGAILWAFLTKFILAQPPVSTAAALEKIRFPYSPIGLESLPWWVAKDAKSFEKYGLDVEMPYESFRTCFPARPIWQESQVPL